MNHKYPLKIHDLPFISVDWHNILVDIAQHNRLKYELFNETIKNAEEQMRSELLRQVILCLTPFASNIPEENVRIIKNSVLFYSPQQYLDLVKKLTISQGILDKPLSINSFVDSTTIGAFPKQVLEVLDYAYSLKNDTFGQMIGEVLNTAIQSALFGSSKPGFLYDIVARYPLDQLNARDNEEETIPLLFSLLMKSNIHRFVVLKNLPDRDDKINNTLWDVMNGIEQHSGVDVFNTPITLKMNKKSTTFVNLTHVAAFFYMNENNIFEVQKLLSFGKDEKMIMSSIEMGCDWQAALDAIPAIENKAKDIILKHPTVVRERLTKHVVHTPKNSFHAPKF